MTALGCLGVLALFFLLGALSIGFYFRGRHQRALRDVRAEVNRIHAAGEPITTADMVEFHRVPDGMFDATQLWIDAIQAAKSVDGQNLVAVPIVGNGQLADLRADAQQSLAESFLAANAETIDKTRKAAAAGGQCRYPIDFSQGIMAPLPLIQEARGLARVLSLRLHVAAERKDLAKALESLELEIALAHTMDHEPTLVAQLVRMAVINIALKDLRTLLGELPLSEPQLAALQKQIAAIDVQRSVKDGLLGERAMGYHTFHHLRQLEGMEMLAGKDGEMQRPRDLRVYLEHMKEMLEAADEPLAQARLSANQIEDNLKMQIATQNPLDRLEIVVTAQLMPGTVGAFDASARTHVLRDSVLCAIAFRRYQLAHGQPPDSLAALVPEFLPAVPLDPLDPTGAPLTLVIDADQFAIYGIGRNQRDDRALLRDPESSDDDGLVVRLAVPGMDDSSTASNGKE